MQLGTLRANLALNQLTVPYRFLWGGPVSTDGLELAISICEMFSSSLPLIRTPGGFSAARSAAQAAEGSE